MNLQFVYEREYDVVVCGIGSAGFTAAVACFNNIGPGFAAVGPMGGFAGYTVFSKLVFSAAMLLGRLEIFPLLIAVSPSVWRGRGRN